MKKKLCFTLILLVFLFSTKDVFASRDALLLLKDKINESNYIEKIIELNPGEDYFEDIKVNANSYGNSIKLDLVSIEENLPLFEFYVHGYLEGNILTFNLNNLNLKYQNNIPFFKAVLCYMAMDAYGQLVGLDPYYLFDSIILLIEDVLSDYDGELEYFNYNYEGINLFQSGTESVTVTLDLDYIEVPEEIIEEDSDSEDIKEEIKDEIIDVNPPTGLNTHYLSLSILGITTIFSLFKLNKKKYLV